ncbi:MAG: acyltransferase family protein [Mucilaginibacter sp.]
MQLSHYFSLDGLRGIAILMVVSSHLNLFSFRFSAEIFNGKLGVLIFFVLSGFLITTLCLKERALTQNISLKNFYIRRALRIFPVAYLYLIVVIVLNLVFKLNINIISILGAALYVMNITSIFRRYYFSWYTGHYWSLSVEEQFYLIFPFLLKRYFSLYLWSLLVITFVLPVFICLQNYYQPLNNVLLYGVVHYLIKFQAIAVGCLFSVLCFKYKIKIDGLRKWKFVLNLIAIALILFINYDDFLTVENMFKGLFISFLTGYIIITNITHQADLIFKLLNTDFLKIVGGLSYSLYIWQQIFASNDSRLPHFMTARPFNLICIVIVSCLSYYIYERYFLDLKKRYDRVELLASKS